MENSNDVAEKEKFWSEANRVIDTANKLVDIIEKGRNVYAKIRGPRTAQIYRTLSEMVEKVKLNLFLLIMEFLL